MPLSSVVGAQSIVKPGVCTSSTRPASPYDGQVIYETDTDKIAVYDSTAWVYKTGASAPTAPGIVLIKAQTVGSAVSSVEVTDAFSASYNCYKITYNGGTCSAQCDLLMRLGSSTSGYYTGIPITDVTNSATGAYTVNNGSSMYCGFGSTNSGIVNIEIQHPYQTQYKYGSISTYIKQGTNNVGSGYIAHLSNTSYTAFTILTSTGTMTGGTIRVYGYANS